MEQSKRRSRSGGRADTAQGPAGNPGAAAPRPAAVLPAGADAALLTVSKGSERLAPPASRIYDALQAINLVLRYSAKLKIQHGERSAFWAQFFGSQVMNVKPQQPPEYLAWLVDQSTFFPPHIVLEFGDLKSDKQMSAVRQFFVRDDPDRRVYSRFGLSFAGCKLSTTCLRLIQWLLEDLSALEAVHQRRCGIHSLDLSHNPMRQAQIDIVAEILSKNHVYKLHEINLENITLIPSPSRKDQKKLWLFPSHASQPNLLGLTRAAFCAIEPLSKSTGGLQRARRSLSLAENPLSVEEFAAMGSSLRYGCVYDEISLAAMVAMLQCMDDAPKREECWRWVAFGLFYRRSASFASAFQLKAIDLSRVILREDEASAFMRTMLNPVAEFRLTERAQSVPSESGDAVIVCRLAPGATIYPLPDKTSAPMMALGKGEMWEALYTRDDTEWLNVVVPGYGLGWVEAKHVGEREHEQLVWTERLELILDSFQTHVIWKIRSRIVTYGTGNSLNTFLVCISHRVRSLQLRNVEQVELLEAVFNRCSNLEHLDLQGSAFESSQRWVLFMFLRSLSGCHLRSLNLKGISTYNEDAQELAELLKYPLLGPRFRELRLFSSSQSAVGLEMLSDALEENRTLALVELHASFPDKVQRQFSTKHNQECVGMTTLPLAHKLAFISALSNIAAQAGNIIDSGILELIFELTGFAIQRRILWINRNDSSA